MLSGIAVGSIPMSLIFRGNELNYVLIGAACGFSISVIFNLLKSKISEESLSIEEGDQLPTTSPAMGNKEYVLKQMLWVPPLTIIFFGMAAKLLYQSAVNHDSIEIYGVIKLSGLASTIFFWGLFVFSIGLVLVGIFALLAALQGKRMVTVTRYSVTVPKFSFRGINCIEIPFSTIRSLDLTRAGNGVFLYIHHDKGKSALAKVGFRSKSDFEELYATLLTKCNG